MLRFCLTPSKATPIRTFYVQHLLLPLLKFQADADVGLDKVQVIE